MADLIATLAAMDDAALQQKLGLDAQLTKARKDLDEMDALAGDARKYALERVTSMLNPNIHPSEFGWIKEDAQRKAKKKTAVEEMCDCSPSSMIDDD